MLIRINCPNPNCKKQIRIDARHAGKKISCAGCNQHIRLPTAEELKINVKAAVTAPVTAGEEEVIDFDMLASQAVHAEKAAEVEANRTEMVKFTCPQCDEPIEMAAENAGKRAPCPSCRRIIAVPKIEGPKAKDWREKHATGPSMAKKEEVKLEGAWGNQSVARVSLEALEEAKAIPKVRRKLTVWDYVRFATTAIIVLAVLGTGWWGWKRYRASSLEGNTLAAVQNAIADTKLPADLNAVLRRGLGEWKLRIDSDADIKKDGVAELRKAITSASDPLWAWVLAYDVANIVGPMISLDPVQPGVVDMKFLVQLLASAPPGEPREDVIRALSRSVLQNVKPDKIEAARMFLTAVIKQAIQPGDVTVKDAKGQAVTMKDYSDQLSALGVLAQELIRHNGRESALQLIGNTNGRGERAMYKKGMPVPKPLVAAMAALAQQDLEINKDMETELELGKMVGFYASNQEARGKEILQKRQEAGFDQVNLTSYLALAEQAIEANRMQEAQTRLFEAMKIAEIYTQGRNDAWKLRVYAHVKLCELTARAGEIKIAEERINKLKLDEIPTAALIARALVARHRPVQASDGEELLSGLPAKSSGQALAAYSLAMKQAALAGQPEPKIVNAVPDGPICSIATLGGLLGVKSNQSKK
ncbi:MAG TPA: hypothetical protein PLN21_05225 [Gemmatales bacterium]|nr:hypothetical protein [Gemmatales bacterium]